MAGESVIPSFVRKKGIEINKVDLLKNLLFFQSLSGIGQDGKSSETGIDDRDRDLSFREKIP